MNGRARSSGLGGLTQVAFLLSVSVALALIFALLDASEVWPRWNRQIRHGLFTFRGHRPPSDRIALVAFTEASLQTKARWPWSHALMDELLRTILEARPLAVVVSLPMRYEDRIDPTGTARLVRTVRGSGKVYFAVDVEDRARLRGFVQSRSDLALPTDRLLRASAGAGLLETELVGVESWSDRLDGTLRVEGATYDGIETLLKRRLTGARPQSGAFVDHLGPMEQIGSTIDVVGVLNGKIPPGRFRGKVVLLGGSAPGLSVHRSTPFGPTSRFAYALAKIDSVFSKREIRRLPFASAFAFLFLLSLPAIRLGYGQRVHHLLITCSLSAVVWTVLTLWSFVSFGLIFPVVSGWVLLGVVAAAGIFSTTRRFQREWAVQRAQLRALTFLVPNVTAFTGPDGGFEVLLRSMSDLFGITRLAVYVARDPGGRLSLVAQLGGDVLPSELDGTEVERARRDASSDIGGSGLRWIAVRGAEGDDGLMAVSDDQGLPEDLASTLGSIVLQAARAWKTRQRLVEAQASLDRRSRFASLGQFASGIVHEIKAPLHNLRLALETVGESIGNDEDRELLDEVRKEIGRLVALLDEILSFARPGEDEGRERADLIEVVVSVRRLVESSFRKAGLTLTFESETEEAVIRGRPDRLRQILLNLVDNSRSVLQKGGRLDLRLRRDEVEGGLLLEVEDDGPGIPEALRPRLFDPFVSGRKGGTGLGLYLASTYMDGLGGRIVCCDREGGGTIMRLFFPSSGELLSADDRHGGSEPLG